MKYVNVIAYTLLAGSILIGAGCATTSGSKIGLVVDKNQEATLVSTLEYLPVPKTDDAGAYLPYEPSENPYLAQRGKIKQESIVKYIDAKRALKQKNYRHAEQLFKTLSEEDKNLSGPWIGLGDVALEQKQYDQAVTHYAKAIELNSKNVNAYMRLAKAQRLQGNFLHAQNTYAKSLALWPDFPEAHLNLAVLYDIYLNHPLRAQKHMEAYQFLTNGENKDVARWLAEIQQRTGVPISLVVEKQKAESKPLS
ncbi:tetratricopeptide repeat protein [Cellvibrio sp. ARAG 10.3]|uniref:tetratricopeptide repeat protein n=1 Tax=Cellvibrio sp. ARAG 10.3 TaxID=3451358 RepID=UPI003F44BF23